MTPPRDTRRAQVYATEAMILRLFAAPTATVELAGAMLTLPPEARFASIESVRDHVDRVLAMSAVRERFSRARDPVRVRERRGASAAHYDRMSATIAIPVSSVGRWALRETVVLHELAHHLDESSGSAHGPVFVQTLIDLVEIVIGPEAAFVYRVMFGDAGLV